MSDDCSPPSSWYDPPEPKYALEIKWEEPLPFGSVQCERAKCEEVATVEGEIGDERYPRGSYFAYCKWHYENIIEDTIEDLENYEPDPDED